MPKATSDGLHELSSMAVAALVCSSMGLFAVFTYWHDLYGAGVVGAGLVGFNLLFAIVVLLVRRRLSPRVAQAALWLLLAIAAGGMVPLLLHIVLNAER